MSIRLHEIPNEALEIEAALTDGFGELTPELEAKIAAFVAQGKDKIESAAIVVKAIEADALTCKTESQRLSNRAQGLENGAKRLKALMLTAVDAGFNGKVKTAKFTIWGQTSPSTVAFALKPGADIYALAADDPELVRMSQPELNLSAIHEAHKAKAALPEAITVEDKPGTRYLRIK
jgi:hypothetical protein